MSGNPPSPAAGGVGNPLQPVQHCRWCGAAYLIGGYRNKDDTNFRRHEKSHEDRGQRLPEHIAAATEGRRAARLRHYTEVRELEAALELSMQTSVAEANLRLQLQAARDAQLSDVLQAEALILQYENSMNPPALQPAGGFYLGSNPNLPPIQMPRLREPQEGSQRGVVIISDGSSISSESSIRDEDQLELEEPEPAVQQQEPRQEAPEEDAPMEQEGEDHPMPEIVLGGELWQLDRIPTHRPGDDDSLRIHISAAEGSPAAEEAEEEAKESAEHPRGQDQQEEGEARVEPAELDQEEADRVFALDPDGRPSADFWMRGQHVRPTAHEALACLKAMLRYFQEYPPQ
jgi:hypothetical protein